jgi:hypothetical protein
MVCPQCDGLAPTVNLKYEYEYWDPIEQLRQMPARNRLKQADGASSPDEIKPNGVWAWDFIEHVFQCTKCRQNFALFCETYHRSGATWKPTEHSTTGSSRMQ